MDFAIQNMGERGYYFVSIAHSISSFVCFSVVVHPACQQPSTKI